METNVNYAMVGAFVISLIAAMVLGIIWLSSGFSFQIYSTYEVYMQESVSGLNIDSPVEFNGVNVGSVKAIELDHNNPQFVAVLLSVKASTPITEGTVATIQTRGVTGVTFIAMKDKSDNLIPLKAKEGEPYPIIKTGPSLFTRLDTTLSKLSDNLEHVSVSIQELLDKDNQRNIKNILQNLSRISSNLAENNARMTRIMENTERASLQFVPLIRNTSNVMHTFETQTLPATYQLMNNLDSITRSLMEVASEMRQNPSVLIRGVQRQSTGPGEKP